MLTLAPRSSAQVGPASRVAVTARCENCCKLSRSQDGQPGYLRLRDGLDFQSRESIMFCACGRTPLVPRTLPWIAYGATLKIQFCPSFPGRFRPIRSLPRNSHGPASARLDPAVNAFYVDDARRVREQNTSQQSSAATPTSPSGDAGCIY